MLEERLIGGPKLLVSQNLEVRDGPAQIERPPGATIHIPAITRPLEETQHPPPKNTKPDAHMYAVRSRTTATLSPCPSRCPSPALFSDLTCCAICGKPSSTPETRCNSIRYCSKTCQASDWPSHRLLCKKLAALPARPSPFHRLAIFFPQDRPSPSLVWVLCERALDDVGTKFEYAHAAHFLGRDDPVPDDVVVSTNERGPWKLQNALEVVTRESAARDGSAPNQSVRRCVDLAGSSPSFRHLRRWLGPVVVLRLKGNNPSPPRFYADITLADFRHALDYFESEADALEARSLTPKPASLLNISRCSTPTRLHARSPTPGRMHSRSPTPSRTHSPSNIKRSCSGSQLRPIQPVQPVQPTRLPIHSLAAWWAADHLEHGSDKTVDMETWRMDPMAGPTIYEDFEGRCCQV